MKIYLELSLNTPSVLLKLTTMQTDVDLLVSRAESQGLGINSGKTAVLRLSRGNKPNTVQCYFMNRSLTNLVASDLGLVTDTTLNFYQHIRVITNKASGIAFNKLENIINRESPLYKLAIVPSMNIRYTEYEGSSHSRRRFNVDEQSQTQD